MLKKALLMMCVAAVMLTGCKKEPPEPAKPTSKIMQLEKDASVAEMVAAFEEDYARAAEVAGIAPKHTTLKFEDYGEWAGVQLTEDIDINFSPPSEYHRVWYTGTPETVDWMKEEAQLVFMAYDDTISAEDAKALIDQLFEDAWDNHENMPSAVDHITPNKLYYSLSTDEWWSISFFVSNYDR